MIKAIARVLVRCWKITRNVVEFGQWLRHGAPLLYRDIQRGTAEGLYSINRSNQFFLQLPGRRTCAYKDVQKTHGGNYCTSPCLGLEHSTGSMTITPA